MGKFVPSKNSHDGLAALSPPDSGKIPLRRRRICGQRRPVLASLAAPAGLRGSASHTNLASVLDGYVRTAPHMKFILSSMLAPDADG